MVLSNMMVYWNMLSFTSSVRYERQVVHELPDTLGFLRLGEAWLCAIASRGGLSDGLGIRITECKLLCTASLTAPGLGVYASIAIERKGHSAIVLVFIFLTVALFCFHFI